MVTLFHCQICCGEMAYPCGLDTMWCRECNDSVFLLASLAGEDSQDGLTGPGDRQEYQGQDGCPPRHVLPDARYPDDPPARD